ncbi:hypothetical protein SAMN04488061_2369 [Filomicrobium insigne]|uniref:AB hydrolase-1 domain-containing protein n=1 Tax=Filomicrobium insigne TaxID=418854 RepID=A0A1H0QGJ8_9HYPH|nr:hypothetical protein [Filomicrobium insigne]SDP16457.1 hypothetical protein SAMN04488061_2369 [Filomicrobium insigne]
MATIVTVHGTFASGPLEGTKWWQRGSRFTTQLQNSVEGDDGTLKIEPCVWDGLNSETSRRAAGKQLMEKLTALETAGEPFVVVGHSHGGSVISAALLHSAKQREPLSGMQRWITVGTPFIKTERQRFLFSRLGIFGKAIYLTLLTFLILGILSVFVGADDREPMLWALAALTFGGPITVFYAILRYMESRRSLRFNRGLLGFAADHYANRWLSLWHAKDEAVQSLKAIKSLDIEIFSREFAASSLNLLAIAIIPLLCLLTLTSEPMMDAIASHVFARIDGAAVDELYPSGGSNIFENAAVLFIGLLVLPTSLILPPEAFRDMSMGGELGLLAAGIAVLLVGAVFLTWAFNGLARVVSHGLSHVLNPMTLSQLKALAYGSDAREDLAIDASEWPVWLTKGFPPLPPEIADGIERESDHAIGRAIPKFRNIVESLAAAETPEATSDVLADYLTWQELIHTSYFDEDRFAKLLAYTIGQCEGFRLTASFEQDADYPEIAKSYAAIVTAAYATTVKG